MGQDRVKRKVLYVTGTRADYGLMRSALKKIQDDPNLDLEIAVTGMHLMKGFGETVNEIKQDNFKIHILDAIYEKGDPESMALFVGKLIQLLTAKVQEIQPDIILLLGDRGEMLAGAVVGAYMALPVAHIHGGDLSSTVDDAVRHAITKLAHIHLAASAKSAERIIKMGENPERVFLVGAPGLDAILNEDYTSSLETAKKYSLDLNEPIIIAIQHPVILDSIQTGEQMRETLEAIADLEYQTIIIYPNADSGSNEMIDAIKEYSRCPFIKTFMSIPRKDYLGLIRIASVLVGNSSSGMIEAPSIGLPVVNIGSRQENREGGANVIDVGYSKEEIKDAILKALNDSEFIKKARCSPNPYGDGKAGERVAQILSNINIDNNLLQKKLSY